jgi:hypothetical protein
MRAHAGLGEWIAAAPFPQRVGLAMLLALGCRPRGRALLRSVGPANQLAESLLGMRRYDDPEVSAAVGWDPRAVVARGRELRHSEGRP